jgi:hypothetical protein
MTELLIAGIAMAVAVVVHAVSVRREVRHVRALGLSLVGGACAAVAGAFVAFVENGAYDPWNGALTLLLYLSWGFIFLNFVQSAQSSLRVQILRQVLDAGGRMSREDLLAGYDTATVVSLRIERMVEGRALCRENGRVVVSSRPLLLLARLFRVLKLVVVGRATEFDGRRMHDDGPSQRSRSGR